MERESPENLLGSKIAVAILRYRQRPKERKRAGKNHTAGVNPLMAERDYRITSRTECEQRSFQLPGRPIELVDVLKGRASRTHTLNSLIQGSIVCRAPVGSEPVVIRNPASSRDQVRSPPNVVVQNVESSGNSGTN